MIILTVHLLEVVLHLVCHPHVGLKCQHLTTARDRETPGCQGSAETKQPAQDGERSAPRGGFMLCSCVHLAGGNREVHSCSGVLFRPEVYKNPEIRIFSLFLRNRWLFILRCACRKLPGQDDLSAVHWV